MAQVIRKYTSGGSTPFLRPQWVDGVDSTIKLYDSKYDKDRLKELIFGRDYLWYRSGLGLSKEEKIELDKTMNLYIDGLISGRMYFDGNTIKDTSGEWYNDGDYKEDPLKSDKRNNVSILATNYLVDRFKRSKPFQTSSMKDAYEFDLKKALGESNANKLFDQFVWDAKDPQDPTTGKRGTANRLKAIIDAFRKEGTKLYQNIQHRGSFGWSGDTFQDLELHAMDTANLLFKIANDLQDGKVSEQDKALIKQLGIGESDIDDLLSVDTDKSHQLAMEKKAKEEAEKALADQKAKEAAVEEQNAKDELAAKYPLGYYHTYPWEKPLFYINGEVISDFNSQLYLNNLDAVNNRNAALTTFNEYAIADDDYELHDIRKKYKYLSDITASMSFNDGFAKNKGSDAKVYIVKNNYDDAGVIAVVNGASSKKPGIVTYFDSVVFDNNTGLLGVTKNGTTYAIGKFTPNATNTYVRLYLKALELGPNTVAALDSGKFDDVVASILLGIYNLTEDGKKRFNPWFMFNFVLKFYELVKNGKLSLTKSPDSKTYTIKGTHGNVILTGAVEKDGKLFYTGINYAWVKGKNKYTGDNARSKVKLPSFHEGGSIPKGFTGLEVLRQQKEMNAIAALANNALTAGQVNTSNNYYKPSTPNASFSSFDKAILLARSGVDLDNSDYVRLGGALADVTSAVAGFIPGLNIASAGVGVAATAAELGADIVDWISGRPGALGFWGFASEAVLNAGMDLVSLLPGGKSAKLAKGLKTIASYVPYIAGAIQTVITAASPNERASIKETWDKISDGRFAALNTKDYQNITFSLRTILGVKGGIKSMVPAKKLSTGKVRALVQTSDGMKTVEVTVPHSQIKTFSTNKETAKKHILSELNKEGSLYKKVDAEGKPAKFTEDDIDIDTKLFGRVDYTRDTKDGSTWEPKDVFENVFGLKNKGTRAFGISDKAIMRRAADNDSPLLSDGYKQSVKNNDSEAIPNPYYVPKSNKKKKKKEQEQEQEQEQEIRIVLEEPNAETEEVSQETVSKLKKVFDKVAERLAKYSRLHYIYTRLQYRNAKAAAIHARRSRSSKNSLPKSSETNEFTDQYNEELIKLAKRELKAMSDAKFQKMFGTDSKNYKKTSGEKRQQIIDKYIEKNKKKLLKTVKKENKVNKHYTGGSLSNKDLIALSLIHKYRGGNNMSRKPSNFIGSLDYFSSFGEGYNDKTMFNDGKLGLQQLLDALNMYLSKNNLFTDINSAYTTWSAANKGKTINDFINYYNNSISALRKTVADRVTGSYKENEDDLNLYKSLYKSLDASKLYAPLTFTSLDDQKDLRSGKINDTNLWLDNLGYLRLGEYGNDGVSKIDDVYGKTKSSTSVDYGLMLDLIQAAGATAVNHLLKTGTHKPIYQDPILKKGVTELGYWRGIKSIENYIALQNAIIKNSNTSSNVGTEINKALAAFSKLNPLMTEAYETHYNELSKQQETNRTVENDNSKALIEASFKKAQAIEATSQLNQTEKNAKFASIATPILEAVKGITGDVKDYYAKATENKLSTAKTDLQILLNKAHELHLLNIYNEALADTEFVKKYKNDHSLDDTYDINLIDRAKLINYYLSTNPNRKTSLDTEWESIKSQYDLQYLQKAGELIRYPGQVVHKDSIIYDKTTKEILIEGPDGSYIRSGQFITDPQIQQLGTEKLSIGDMKSIDEGNIYQWYKKGGSLTLSDRKKLLVMKDYSKAVIENQKMRARQALEDKKEFNKMLKELSKNSKELLKASLQL